MKYIFTLIVLLFVGCHEGEGTLAVKTTVRVKEANYLYSGGDRCRGTVISENLAGGRYVSTFDMYNDEWDPNSIPLKNELWEVEIKFNKIGRFTKRIEE